MKSARTQRRSRSVGILETLEGRRLLSGNVTAVYNPLTATVVVKGDNKSNDIIISPGNSFAYTITGRDGTKVNGLPSVDVVVPGISNFSVDTGNGEDVVELNGYVVNNAVITTGNGEDSVIVANAEVDSNLTIDTGNGGDKVAIAGIIVFGNLDIDTGNGPDSIDFGTVGGFFVDVTVGGNTKIDGGNGPDILTDIAQLHTLGTQTIVGVESIL